ncbi:MAG TPA: hypothetical protein VIL18_02070, partial [Longimicrobiales bacterium]
GRSWNALPRRSDSVITVAGFDKPATIAVLRKDAVVQREEYAPAGHATFTTEPVTRSYGVRPRVEQWQDNVRAGEERWRAEREPYRRGGRRPVTTAGHGLWTPVSPQAIP